MRWLVYVLPGLIGLCGGLLVATGLAAFMIGLGIIPRYAGITHTADRILWYENALVLGAILGNLVSIYHLDLPIGRFGMGIAGLSFGIFLGGWIIALAEVVNVFAIMARRIKLKKGTAWIVGSIALGKTAGSLIQFFVLR